MGVKEQKGNIPVTIAVDILLNFKRFFPLTTIFLLEGAPHPNAVKVYINWLLSQKTQMKLCKNVELNSRRTDVPVVVKETAIDLAKLSKYRNSSIEENIEFDDSLLPMIKEALKK